MSPGAPIDQQLRQALAERSYLALAESLRTGRFGVAVADGTTVVATSPQGVRSLAVFSGPDAAAAWGGADRLRIVDGAGLVRLALPQPVDSVLLAPAGPVPAELALTDLRLLADGLVPGESGPLQGATAFQVRAAEAPPRGLDVVLTRACRELSVPLWVFERRAAGPPVLTVGVEGTSDQAAQVAARLGAWGADQPGRVPDLDVVLLAGDVLRAVAAQVPHGRVAPA